MTAEGTPTRTAAHAPTPQPEEERTGLRQFLQEVRAELRKVVWPTAKRSATTRSSCSSPSSSFTAFVAVLDYAVRLGALWLYDR